MDKVISFISSPVFLPWFILFGVVIFERFWPLPSRFDPLVFIRFLAQRMAQRVCPSKNASTHKSQFWISGSLAAFMIIVPFILILAIFREFVFYPELFDACILYFSIQFSSHIHRFQQIKRALAADKKTLSKELLAPMVLRETNILSSIGISKAAVESLILRFHYQALVCMFLFILIGPIATLSYRLCYELHLVWNTKIPAYREFGKPVAKLCYLFQWLPVRLNALLSVFLSKGFTVFTYLNELRIDKNLFKSHGALLLRAHQFAFDINLSGPVYYQKLKVQRTKFISKGEPAVQFMPNALALINRVLIVNLLLLLLTCLITNTLIVKLGSG